VVLGVPAPGRRRQRRRHGFAGRDAGLRRRSRRPGGRSTWSVTAPFCVAALACPRSLSRLSQRAGGLACRSCYLRRSFAVGLCGFTIRMQTWWRSWGLGGPRDRVYL